MGTRSLAAAVCVSLLSVGCAVVCYTRAAALHTEARWLLERGNAQAVEYAQSLDNTIAEAQLETFAARRSLMEQAHVWQRGQMFGLMLVALSAVVAYMLMLLRRIDSQLDDAVADAPPELPPEAPPASPGASSKPSSALVPSPHR